MPSNRIFYASKGISIDDNFVPGVQSVALGTSFDVSAIPELCGTGVYTSYVKDTSVEVTVNRLVESSTIYSGNINDNRTRGDRKICIAVGEEPQDSESLLETASSIKCTGLYINNVSYQMSTDSFLTEAITFVGGNKSIGDCSVQPVYSGADETNLKTRAYFSLENSILPSNINNKIIQSINTGVDFNFTSIKELGARKSFKRYASTIIEAYCDIEVLLTTPDLNDSTDILNETSPCDNQIFDEYTIKLDFCGIVIDLGEHCRLVDIQFREGDVGGGNAVLAYKYKSFNFFNVT